MTVEAARHLGWNGRVFGSFPFPVVNLPLEHFQPSPVDLYYSLKWIFSLAIAPVAILRSYHCRLTWGKRGGKHFFCRTYVCHRLFQCDFDPITIPPSWQSNRICVGGRLPKANQPQGGQQSRALRLTLLEPAPSLASRKCPSLFLSASYCLLCLNTAVLPRWVSF